MADGLPQEDARAVVMPAPDATFMRALLIGSALSTPLWIVALTSLLHIHLHL